ncbi:MAG TPA: histidine phosphatase family protein [Vicinamibacterales bacterium]|jgi:broad specificity phosphatase PhoE|nr:histidine phosphatase family protein [Vicinamibacterales bacterium]
MITRVFLVRHGATTLTADDRFAGSSDVPLGPDGQVQVERLADRLAAAPLAALYSSPLQRSVTTATVVGRPHGLAPVLGDGLREIDHGRWEGLRRDEVQRMYPDEYAAWEHDPVHVAPQGGETGKHVLARALPVINDIIRRHAGQSVLVVAHKATNRLLIAHWLGFDLRTYRDRIEQLPACLNLLDFKSPDQARLVLLNDVSHYDLAGVHA